jgi:hypothetical protein
MVIAESVDAAMFPFCLGSADANALIGAVNASRPPKS